MILREARFERSQGTVRVLRVMLFSALPVDLNSATSAYLPPFSTFQNAIPPACWPTSTDATRVSVCRSSTSTLPGAAPAPSPLTKA